MSTLITVSRITPSIDSTSQSDKPANEPGGSPLNSQRAPSFIPRIPVCYLLGRILESPVNLANTEPPPPKQTPTPSPHKHLEKIKIRIYSLQQGAIGSIGSFWSSLLPKGSCMSICPFLHPRQQDARLGRLSAGAGGGNLH